MLKRNQKGFMDHWLIIAIVVVLLVGGFVAWRVLSSDDTETDQTDTTQTSENQEPIDEVAENDTENMVPEGWIEYVDDETGVSFYHPGDWEQYYPDVNDNNPNIVDPDWLVSTTPLTEKTYVGGGAPFYWLFDEDTNDWILYNNAGENANENNPLKDTENQVEGSLVTKTYAYGGEGGSCQGFSIIFAHGDTRYSISTPYYCLPITGFDDPEKDQEKYRDLQKAALEDIIKTVNIK